LVVSEKYLFSEGYLESQINIWDFKHFQKHRVLKNATCNFVIKTSCSLLDLRQKLKSPSTAKANLQSSCKNQLAYALISIFFSYYVICRVYAEMVFTFLKESRAQVPRSA
jgi:hypothetical protein